MYITKTNLLLQDLNLLPLGYRASALPIETVRPSVSLIYNGQRKVGRVLVQLPRGAWFKSRSRNVFIVGNLFKYIRLEYDRFSKICGIIFQN